MKLFLLGLMALTLTTVQAGIVTREVSYPAGSVTARGFLALPEDGGKHPGVLVVHEWWGLNDYARKRAEQLAALGYVALAVDMYGDGKVAGHPKDAGSFAAAVMKDLPEARRRFEGALAFLAKQPGVDPDKIAAIGYCFGGGLVLQMACEGVPGLKAVASFHGSLGAEVPQGVKPTARMLVCHGAEDNFIPSGVLEAFPSRMKAAGVDLEFHSYPGAKHGFTNPDADKVAKEFDLNVAYDAKADAESWKALQKFLKKSFAD
jgi:dienelactone hydrolase